jgi:ABC-type nitrate/sulfonate/bicarbonate transport system ATPase subunit
LRILGGLDAVTQATIEIRSATRGRPQHSIVFQGDSIFPG